jgi:phage shock protein PspC (stress-responsive transcriptional regulator)
VVTATVAAASPRTRRPAPRRRTENRVIAGVAGGCADWLNAPVSTIRGVLLLAAFSSPWVVAVYAAAAFVIPARGRVLPGWDNLIGLGRLALLMAGPTLLTGLEITLTGVLSQPIVIWLPVSAILLAGAAALLAADYRRDAPRTVAESRAVVLATLPFVAAGGLLVGAVALWPDVSWEVLLPFALIGAGIGVLIAVRVGGWRRLVAPVAVTAVVVAHLVAADVRLDGGVGELRVSAVDSVTAHRALGDVHVDVGGAGRTPVTVRVSAGIGDVTVTVPAEAKVVVDAHVGRGVVYLPVEPSGDVLEGYGLDVHERRTSPRGHGSVHVVADVGLGKLDVRRADPTQDPSR